MEQERNKREGDETDFHFPNPPILCSNNCGFFGRSVTNNLCSKCYRATFPSKKQMFFEAMSALLPEEDCGSGANEESEKGSGVGEVEEIPVKKPANRCSFCNNRVGLMGFKCRCGDVFCSVHRYSDEHDCVFDYKGVGQDEIAKSNPVVKPDKVEKI